MNNKIQEAVNEAFIDVMDTVHREGPFSLLVPIDERWKKPLPASIQNGNEMMLTIEGWSYEESEVSEEGINVVCAFGDEENQAWYDWSEVYGIFSESMEPIFLRTFLPEQTEYTLKELMF